MPKKLRFAPLIRVSTEKQAKKGESLATQKQQIIDAVEILGGVIPKKCWRYTGQESATNNEERKLLDQLLADCSKNLFDAIIVADSSRWSRNNLKSETGLEILRQNQIKFFELVQEIDLFDPDQLIILQLKVNIHSFSALQNAKKSLMNRIKKAKEGCPGSALPYARTFNKNTGQWGIDPEKHELVKQAASDYLNGEKLEDVARILGCTESNLYKIFHEKCGNVYVQHFRSSKFNISVDVPTPIPRLLPESMIRAIKDRMKDNRTLYRDQIKHKYLLKSFVYCAKCGYSCIGVCQTGIRYYRHTYYKINECRHLGYIPAEKLEVSVFVDLFDLFGDVNKVRAAMEAASPDTSEYEKLDKKKETLLKQLASCESQKNRVVKAISLGIIQDDDAKKQMNEIKDRMTKLQEKLSSVESDLSRTISKKQISERSKQLMLQIEKSYARTDFALDKMSWQDMRKMVESLFSGDKFGVYVTRVGRHFNYEIRMGIAREIQGSINNKAFSNRYIRKSSYNLKVVGSI